MSVILGLNFNHADSSACLFVDNNLKFAIELFVLESISLNELSVDIFNKRSLPNGLFDSKLFLSK